MPPLGHGVSSSSCPHVLPAEAAGGFVEGTGEDRIRGGVLSFLVEAGPGKARSVF